MRQSGVVPFRRLSTLGVNVSPLDAVGTAKLLLERLRSGGPLLLGNLNLHGVYLYHTDPQFAAFCDRCDVVLIDGAPLAWVAGVRARFRVGSTDWLDALLPRAAGVRILAIGGTPDVSAGAERHFRAAYPSVEWNGVDGYVSAQLDESLRLRIRAADLILVGMGMPLQEKWILDNMNDLEGKVVANIGGCLDYYVGAQRLAPRWLGAVGLEWMYRLLMDPRRLARRYLVEPFLLVGVLVKRSTVLFGRRLGGALLSHRRTE